MARPRLSPWTQWRTEKPLKRRPLELVPGFLSRTEAASLRLWGEGRLRELKVRDLRFPAPSMARLLWQRFSESQWNSVVDAYNHRWRAVGLHHDFVLTTEVPVKPEVVVLGATTRSFGTFWVFLNPGPAQASVQFLAPKVSIVAEEGLLLLFLTQDWRHRQTGSEGPQWLLQGHVMYQADPWRSADEEVLRGEWASAQMGHEPEVVRGSEQALSTLFGRQSEKVMGLSGEDIIMEDLLLAGSTSPPLSPPPEP